MLAPWIQEAKERALKARECMVKIDCQHPCPPYRAAVFGLGSYCESVGWGEPDGGGAYWVADDECAEANAELLAHARDDILKMVELLEQVEKERAYYNGWARYTAVPTNAKDGSV